MVTAILLFIFVGPRFIDFKDKPVTNVPSRSSEVLVRSTSGNGEGAVRFTYEISANDLAAAHTDSERNTALLRIIEPIAGEVVIEGIRPVYDSKDKLVAYDATVRR
jgi:hypothetical protein